MITYTIREIEPDRIYRVEEEINAWQQEFKFLVRDVICSAEFELDFKPLEAAKLWTCEKVDRLKEHIWGRWKLEMPRGSLQVLLSEYRNIWEGVWVEYLRNERTATVRHFREANIGAGYGMNLGGY